MNNILAKIQQIASHEGITIGAMERSIGASKGVLSRAITNGTDIQSKWLLSIVENYPQYSAEWLLTGEGNMLKAEAPCSGEAAPEGAKSKKISGTKARKAEKDTQGIPLIPLSAMAGAFTSDISVMEYECEHYIIPDFKGADFIIRVKGDSMLPTYYSGDLVACQKISLQDIFFQWNKTYVLDTDQGPLIKRVRRGTDDNHILIVSDNASYEPFELDRAQLHAVALVRGIIRLE